jgi:hypothetical protein
MTEVDDVLATGAGGLDGFDTYSDWEVAVAVDAPEIRVSGGDEFLLYSAFLVQSACQGGPMNSSFTGRALPSLPCGGCARLLR